MRPTRLKKDAGALAGVRVRWQGCAGGGAGALAACAELQATSFLGVSTGKV